MEEELDYLIDLIKMKKTVTPKMLIYCRTVNTADSLYMFLVDRLEEDAYAGPVRSVNNRLIGKYHALVGEATRQFVMEKFVKGEMRILVCTIAFGLGVDVSDVSHVIHWGVPDNALCYWQEIGRAGRNGALVKASLYVVRKLFTPAIEGNFLNNMKDICGIPLTLAVNTGKHKACQTQSENQKVSTSVTPPMATESKNHCLRRMVLRDLFIPGMKHSAWIFSDPVCSSDCKTCTLRKCCSLCASLCSCTS